MRRKGSKEEWSILGIEGSEEEWGSEAELEYNHFNTTCANSFISHNYVKMNRTKNWWWGGGAALPVERGGTGGRQRRKGRCQHSAERRQGPFSADRQQLRSYGENKMEARRKKKVKGKRHERRKRYSRG